LKEVKVALKDLSGVLREMVGSVRRCWHPRTGDGFRIGLLVRHNRRSGRSLPLRAYFGAYSRHITDRR
jgi:hypothetical protein